MLRQRYCLTASFVRNKLSNDLENLGFWKKTRVKLWLSNRF